MKVFDIGWVVTELCIKVPEEYNKVQRVSTLFKRTCGHEKRNLIMDEVKEEARHIYEGLKIHPAGVISGAL